MTETNTSRSATQSEPTSERDPATETPKVDQAPVPSAQQQEAVNGASTEEAAPAEEAAPEPAERELPAIYASAVSEPGMPEASPDGQWLAYLYPEADGTHALWLSPTDGGDAVRLELPFQPVHDTDPDTGRQIRGPQWSPDGATIALTGLHPDGDRTAVWLVTLDTGQVEVAAPEPAQDAAETDAEPDTAVEAEATATTGEETAEAPATEDQSAPETKQPTASVIAPHPAPTVEHARLLADLRSPTRSPRWSPDDQLMLVVMTQDGVDQIGLAQPDLGDLPPMIEPITSGVLAQREPIWSRDGRFVAFTRQIGSDWRFADICTFEPRTGELKNLTGEKEPNVRHTLDWVPGRNLVAFVTRDGDWLGIAVVNADNKAGWMVTREAGDKGAQRFAPDEARLIYIRSEGFSTVLVERGLHGSNSVALDPGEGVVTTPIWADAKKVAYGFSAPQKPLGWLVQETSTDAERTVVTLPEMVAANRVSSRHPVPFEFEVGPEEQFSGLVYETDGIEGTVPGIVYVPDGPLTARLAGFQREEQALAASGMAVLAPVLHGASGFGTAVEDDLAEYGDDELEAADLAAAGEALGARERVDENKLAIVGHGFGGALAMIAAGARPGVYRTVVAIDPVTDWTIELDLASRPWRRWVTRQYGLPLTSADRYALRTPETFAGVIDGELILVSTPGAPEARQVQLAEFRAWLDSAGIAHTHLELDAASPAGALYEVGQLLAERLRDPAEG